MEKASQSSPLIKQPECSFCFTPSEEARLLLRGCLQRLRKMLQLKKYSEMQAIKSTQGETTLGIHRLIRVLFEKQQFELTFSKSCYHVKLKSLFRDHLKCRPEQMESAIEDLCDKLARRNYELEIIACQIKNVENSVYDIEEPPTQMQRVRKDSRSSQSDEIRMCSLEAEVKVEELENKPIEGSPPTAANYNLTFENMPMAYNILFYGQSFYQ